MRFSNVFGLVACLTFANALPTPGEAATEPLVSVTFKGAAGAQYSLDVPLNRVSVSTNNPLSISQIASTFDVKAHCTIHGIDSTPVLVGLGPNLWNVGPPQTILTIACTTGSPPVKRVPTISIEFDGAADAKYTLFVPLNGAVIPTNNALSISTIVTTYADLPTCHIVYVGTPSALVKTGTDTWAVGPPQTIESISCSEIIH